MNTREDLIEFIVEYAGDEIQTKNDALKLAKMSTQELKANVESIKQYKVDKMHQDIRDILIKYNSPEYGDCIIDEICNLFEFPMTDED